MKKRINHTPTKNAPYTTTLLTLATMLLLLLPSVVQSIGIKDPNLMDAIN